MAVTKAKPRRRKLKAVFPLKAVLAAYGWSQIGLSKASGIPMNHVNALANGKSFPRWEMLVRIATTIGAELNDFLPKPSPTTPTTASGRPVTSGA